MNRILGIFTFCCASLVSWAQYAIYPVPQKMTALEGMASFSGNVCLVCDAAIDQPTRQRAEQVLREHGLTASVTDGEQQCTSVIYLKVDQGLAAEGKYDAHCLQLEAMGNGMVNLTITGQNTDATFMGLASLEQMLDEKGTSGLPCVRIDDYADQQQRGLVEGYYGYPYSVAVKKDLMRFMMRMKMNTYMYGAKSDPYHLSKWKEAYPDAITSEQEKNGWLSQDMVRDICAESAATKVNFIWSIHPGDNFLKSPTVINDVMAKYQKMYDLGVRQFGVFVDDVSIPSSEADLALNSQRITDLQRAIEERWNGPEAAPADTVKPLNFVPQIYCRDFASSSTQYENFFRALATTPKHIVIYTTGRGVWSVPNAADFNMPKEFLGRDVAWWWNYPCNDNADSQIYPMDMYQNFVDMPAVSSTTLSANLDAGIGIVSNPMQQGEVAKIPLFSVADYAWNHSGFSNKKSWEASFPMILRNADKAAALKKLAPYLTKNDPSGKFPATSESKTRSNVADLLDAIEFVKTFAESDVESDRLLWADLSPWVLKLEQMLTAVDGLIVSKSGERDERWRGYAEAAGKVSELESREDFISYTLEGMYATVGTPHVAQPSEKYLRAYLNTLRTTAVKDLIPAAQQKATGFSNCDKVPAVTDNGTDVYATLAAKTYAPGECAGIELPTPCRLAEVLVTDTLVEHQAVLVSADGRQWTQLQPVGSDTRQIEDFVRYVIVKNASDQPVSFKLTKNVLRLTRLTAPTVTSVTSPVEKDYNERANIYDGNVATFWAPYANQKAGDVIRLNLSKAAPIRKVRLVLHNTNGDIMQTGRIEISQSEKSGYKRLSPEGTTKTSFTQADMTPLHSDGTPYAEGAQASDASIYQLYFDADGQTAQYVRFYNQTPNTSKWLRIAELSPIFDINRLPCVDHEEVCDGLPYTSTHVKAGDELTVDPCTARSVEKIEAFTSRGIIAFPTDDYTLRFDEDCDVYEVVFTISKNAPALDAINSVTTVAPAAVWYDLSGRQTTCPGRGIYFSAGKKIMR